LQFASLELGHKYNFVVTNKKDNKILDDRFLSTVDLNKQGSRVALMSCMNAGKAAKEKTWASAQAANLDYLFFIGDNVYGDDLFSNSSKLLWSKYVASRAAIPYYHWKNMKPVIAVWDDHDFGKNDALGDYKNKVKNAEIFNAFFAQEADGKTLFRGPGISSFFQAFNQNFALCDNRYYRALSYADGSKSFLGVDQINFMTNLVDKNPKFTMLLEGSPWFGRTQKGSTSYQTTAPVEQEAFFNVIKSWGVPVMFGGGDTHFTELSSLDKKILGFNSYEIISSSMHSSNRSNFYDNPNPQLNGYLKENFVVIEQVGTIHDLSWKASCIAADSKKIFETLLKIT
jgi:alkaline phosphatase D